MNKAKLKSYAPAARRDFIKAVSERANFFGIDAKKIEPADIQGDVAIIAGRPFPKKVMAQRDHLIRRVKLEGFELVMRKVAFTWFNRFMALRFMELHGYLDHGFRVLSNPSGSTTPEILEQAAHVQMPGLNHDKVVELKLDGTRDAELYRMLLVALCNALHGAMPFLFERIDDETELLLPDNLLHSDSIIRKLVTSIDEADWQEVEIIGWLYQFYISEKKDEVIGKVVKSEDIPAATQLFTPNWIVKYMVQNSLGRKWLMTYPNSPLKGKMAYYIEPAEQTEEVKRQLAAITPDSLDPETLTLLDPACGSGHILVEAYDLLKEIYLERGYRSRDIPRLILEKNLYGLDIDDRAAQMAGFALLMKARTDDRRLLSDPPKLNVLSLQESKGLDLSELDTHLRSFGIERATLAKLLDTFAHAKTFGSLIEVPENLAPELPKLAEGLKKAFEIGDVFARSAAEDLLLLVGQARVLSMKFDAVVANPPYMGGKWMNELLAKGLKDSFPDHCADVCATFVKRAEKACSQTGFISMVTLQNWLFSSSFQAMRSRVLKCQSVNSLVQIGYNSFPEINSKVAQACSFSIFNSSIPEYAGRYVDLASAEQSANKEALFLTRNNVNTYDIPPEQIMEIPGYPFAYWVSENFRSLFLKGRLISDKAYAKQGLATGDNDRFIRGWHEVSIENLGFAISDRRKAIDSGNKWFPHLKGGPFRRWYGNFEYVVNWSNDGKEIRSFGLGANGRLRSRPQSMDFYFKPGITWSDVTSGSFSSRQFPEGFIFSTVGPALFAKPNEALDGLLGYTNSNVFQRILDVSLQGLHYNNGVIGNRPFVPVGTIDRVAELENELVSISKTDWDSAETSWEFKVFPWARPSSHASTISSDWTAYEKLSDSLRRRMKTLETENNRLFIEAYGLQNELSPEVPENQITLTRTDREKDCQRLISYAIGCMMGRYSLDEPGLIYAHAGNVGFDPTQYKTFPADADGIVPVTDEQWFDDDTANRVREFLLAVWGPETLDENLAWLAESLGKKGSETPEETIRRYLSTSFFKDHLQTYKKRPIYWLFSSGKEKAFECLVYLHRYNESTLSRMRNEYVIPLQGKYAARADYLDNEVKKAPSASAQKKLQKELDAICKKQVELTRFDEELRHFADQRISIDLDDGVKVNYGKFGNLLAEVKAVTGEKE
jgi:hypothetical protein